MDGFGEEGKKRGGDDGESRGESCGRLLRGIYWDG